VESILNRDSKNTTYKLALFRSFCDIAVQASQSVGFDNGRVLIPLHLVAEKWVSYYIPLLANHFIPQREGETESKNHLAFRSAMEDMVSRISPHRKPGSRDPIEIYEIFLSKIALTKTNRIIDVDLGKSIKSLLKILEKAIINGPVTHSGSSIVVKEKGKEDERILRYRHPSSNFPIASISIPIEMWKEFLLFGHWIRDAVLLKWAEETVRFDKGNRFRVSEILEILLSDISPDRTQGLSRKIFEPIPGKLCIWSGISVEESYAIDHLIPFSLSRNNQLWNLLPSDPRVNLKKSDQLPGEVVLKHSESNIFHYWDILSQSDFSNRFYYEVKNFTGQNLERDAGWKTILWEAFRESVETIALHRGVERWGG
jgi:hypothetical protein